MTHILLCHDNVDFVLSRAELWEGDGHEVTVCTTARESLERVKHELGTVEVIVGHKDLGQKNNELLGLMKWNRQLVSKMGQLGLVSLAANFPMDYFM